jgi:hypothetical protein
MIQAAQDFGKYPIAMDADLDRLEAKYADYWAEPYRVLKAEGVE